MASPSRALLRFAALGSSLLLFGGFVSYRVAVYKAAAEKRERAAAAAPAASPSPAAAASPAASPGAAPDPIMMGGSKSYIVDWVPPPSPAAETKPKPPVAPSTPPK